MKWFKSLYNASWSKVPTLQTYNNNIKGTEQSQTNVREECKSKWNLTPFAAYLIAIIIHILSTPHYIKVAKDRHRVGNGNSREQDHEDGSEDAADTPYLAVPTVSCSLTRRRTPRAMFMNPVSFSGGHPRVPPRATRYNMSMFV